MKKKLTALALMVSLVLTMASCSSADDTTTTAGTTTAATTTKKAPTILPPATDGGEDDPTEYTDLFIPYGTATVDGTRDEAWDNAVSVTLDLTKTGTPAADTVVTASTMWDNNAIYFLFEITDSDVFVGGNAGDYNNDSLYLYLSEDVETPVSSLDGFSGGVFQFALISKDLEMIPRKGSADEVKDAQSAYTITDTGMIIEFCYTPTIQPLAAGNFMLIDYQYNDSGASGTRKGGMGWYNGTDTNGSPSLWGFAKLLAEGETAPEV